MHVTLPHTEAVNYLDSIGKDVDWDDKGGDNVVSVEEHDMIQNILTCETSIYMLRRATGFCGSLVDNMVDIRRKFINEYEDKFDKEWSNPNEDEFY